MSIKNEYQQHNFLSNTGFGTVSPTEKVDVSGNTNITGSYKINGTDVLTGNSLGSGITSSSLTSVGTLGSLNVSGNLTVDTNTLFVDSVNDFVGIGSISPTEKLDINGNLRIRGNRVWCGISGSEIWFGMNGTATEGSRLGIAIRGTSTGSVDLVTLRTNGTNRLTILENGNIGIGTTNPTDILHVNGRVKFETNNSDSTDNTSALLFSYGNSAFVAPGFLSNFARGTSTVPLAVQNNDAIFGIYSKTYNGSAFTTNNIAAIRILASENHTTTSNGTKIDFRTTPNGTTTFVNSRMVIDHSGNIGIGTNSPNYSLTIAKNDAILLPVGTTAQRPSTVVDGLLRYNTTNEEYEGYKNGEWGSIGNVSELRSIGIGYSSVGWSSNGVTSQGTVIPNTIVTDGLNGSFIEHSFNVINATTHTFAFNFTKNDSCGIMDVYIDNNLEDTIDLYSIQQTFDTRIYTKTLTIGSKTIKFVANGKNVSSSNFFINVGQVNIQYNYYNSQNLPSDLNLETLNVNGNVGIGTTNPTQKLTLSDPNAPFLRFDRSDATRFDFEIGMPSSADLIFRGGANASGESLIEFMRISGTGNVGIGTTNPGSRLHVAGNILSSGSIDAGTQFLGQASDTATAPSYSWTGDTNCGIFRPGTDEIGFTTNGTEKMRILTNGNVGIGITNPTEKLQVSGNILSTGNVGIGVSNPSHSLDVNGNIRIVNNGRFVFGDSGQRNFAVVESAATTERFLRFRNGGSHPTRAGIIFSNFDAANYMMSSDQLGNLSIDYLTNSELTTQNSTGTNFLKITQTGNIGIGTTEPQAQLHVSNSSILPILLVQPLLRHYTYHLSLVQHEVNQNLCEMNRLNTSPQVSDRMRRWKIPFKIAIDRAVITIDNDAVGGAIYHVQFFKPGDSGSSSETIYPSGTQEERILNPTPPSRETSSLTIFTPIVYNEDENMSVRVEIQSESGGSSANEYVLDLFGYQVQ